MRGVSLLLLSFLSVFAQSEVSISVRATPEGSPFFVDGHRYTSPQFLSWKEGTQHTLTADERGSWTDSFGELGGIGRQVTVQATAEVTEYRVVYTPKPVTSEEKTLSASIASEESIVTSNLLLLWDAVDDEDNDSVTLLASGLQTTDFIEVLVDGKLAAVLDTAAFDGFVAVRIDRPDNDAEVCVHAAGQMSNALRITSF